MPARGASASRRWLEKAGRSLRRPATGLFDTSTWAAFVAAAARRDDLTHAFTVTDSLVEYQQIVARLDPSLPTTRLYGDHLRTFEINTTR
ncbi:hypothetical protein [Cellulomonas carbonis]|uniref:Uncharacterized protein n=1 Tax=Cellulomonas carbonis T26 TaxID=947969 RepID=A0A0A0BY35_9CELL|nr:hypothetical protein [Cellulomonas carbonis]KGM12821.1 hypothetical protein N868_00505 [Cellulomonas carbonis T26]GGC14514.1 hypothetical protein GCM10010972_29790 [Cellulomonas carbonis]